MSLGNLRTLKIKMCRKCRAHITMRMPREDVIARVESYGFKFIRFIEPYEKNSSKIEYECSFGHITKRSINTFSEHPYCKECHKKEFIENQSGSKSSQWRGGLSEIMNFLGNSVEEWKKKSMESCNYKCIITGERFDHVHHLYPMNKIIREAFDNLGLEKKRILAEYSNEEISLLVYEVQRLHTIYPL